MIRLVRLLSLILVSPAPAADEGAAVRDLPGFLSLAYTWASPEAERMGANLRSIQTGLVREGSK